jgi:hypothetical protein
MRSTGALARPNLVAAWGVDELLVRCRFGLRCAPAAGREPWVIDEDGCDATLRLAAVAPHEREDCAFAPVRCTHADPETVRCTNSHTAVMQRLTWLDGQPVHELTRVPVVRLFLLRGACVRRMSSARSSARAATWRRTRRSARCAPCHAPSAPS